MRGFLVRADQGHEICITKSLTSASVIVENTIFIHESICPIHPANQMIQIVIQVSLNRTDGALCDYTILDLNWVFDSSSMNNRIYSMMC